MHLWTFLLLIPGQMLESKDFPKGLQMKAVAATVRIVNRDHQSEGTGVIVGRNGKGIYVLTAGHLVVRSARFEVSAYSENSYPRVLKKYDKVKVVAQSRDIRDLALIRLDTEDRPPAIVPFCASSQLPTSGKFEAMSVGCGARSAPICLLENVIKEKRVKRPPGRDTARFWETDIAQMVGRSGGPLLNSRGELIGLASGASEGKGYYSHGSEIQVWLKETEFAFLLGDKEKKNKE
jgi:S1-C subfamily serine protease